MVDVEGYVTVNTNRYSVPVGWIGRRVEVRETSSKIEIQLDARHLVTHQRIVEAERLDVMLAEHRPPRGVKRPDPHPEEALILKAVPEIAGYVAALKQHSRKLVVLALRQLLRMVREYPREPLLAAVAEAARYGLYDLDRVERMILRMVRATTSAEQRTGEREMKPSDELEQLLKNLHLNRILDIYGEQSSAAEKEDVSYSEFLTRLLERSGNMDRKPHWRGESSAPTCPRTGR